jgi:hypothetical protein
VAGIDRFTIVDEKGNTYYYGTLANKQAAKPARIKDIPLYLLKEITQHQHLMLPILCPGIL